MNDGNGPAFFTAGNVDTYLNLKPVAATTTASKLAARARGSSSWLVGAVGDRGRRWCCCGAGADGRAVDEA